MKSSVINALWHGNIIPQESCQTNTKEMKDLLNHIIRHNESLDQTFTDEQKEIFQKLHDCWNEYVAHSEAAIFEYAFCLGARLALEIQSFEE